MRSRHLLFFALFLAACAPTDEETVALDSNNVVEAGSNNTATETNGADNGNTASSVNAATNGVTNGAVEVRSVFERGRYNVGHRRWDITYDAALEPGRQIKLSVWYPTSDQEGEPGKYLINWQRKEVFRDASVAIEDQAPVLIFSHGNAALAEQSYFMTEFFASHGWVVVAPYHTGNTVFDVVANGGGVSLEAAPLRPQDITAALDAVYALDGDDPLAGKLSDDVLMSGHSFGAFTTIASTGAAFAVDEVVAACAEPNAPFECSMLERDGVEEVFRGGFLDERIDVAIPQAPGGFFAFSNGISEIEIPTLMLTGARDTTLPAASEGNLIWEAYSGAHMRVDLIAGGHFTFSNMCELLPLPEVQNDGCGEHNTPIEVAFELINAYSLAFARYILWGEQSDLLTGVDGRYSEHVRLSWKPESDLN